MAGEHLRSLGRSRDEVTEGLYPGKPAFPGYIGLRRAPIDGSKIQRNIYCTTNGDVDILAEGASPRASWGASYLRDCDADYNLYFSPRNPEWASDLLREKQTEGVEDHSVRADPRRRRIQRFLSYLQDELESDPDSDFGYITW